MLGKLTLGQKSALVLTITAVAVFGAPFTACTSMIFGAVLGTLVFVLFETKKD